MRKIRGNTYCSLETELEEIINAKNSRCSINTLKDFINIMSSRVFLQPFACVGVMFILHRLSAFIVISHNTATYFEFTGTYYNPLRVSISYGVVRLISSLCMPLILTNMTKRMGFISFGSASTLAMLGGIFLFFFVTDYIKHIQHNPTQWQFMLI